MEDARNGSSYLCVVMNDELRSLAQGDDQKIQPVRRTGIYSPANRISTAVTVLARIACMRRCGLFLQTPWRGLFVCLCDDHDREPCKHG